MNIFNSWATRLVHAMTPKEGAIAPSIVGSAAFAYGNAEGADAIFSGQKQAPVYARMGNPTNAQLERVLSEMEGGEEALFLASGMGAISAAMLGLCSAGDEVIVVGGLFGGSYQLFADTLPRYGIQTHFFDVDALDAIKGAITPKTKAIFCESIGNPNLRIPDIKALSKIALEIALVVDNTLTPLIFEPLNWGADIVVHSTTKLINGHASALGGAVVVRGIIDQDDKFHTSRYAHLKPFIDKAGAKALALAIRKRALRDFGMSANAFAAYLTLLGVQTLPLRLQKICENTEMIAEMLFEEGFDMRHPSRSFHEHHKRYLEQFPHGVGPLLTLDMGDKQSAFDFINALNNVSVSANVGDLRTLIIHPQSTIYRDLPLSVQHQLGVDEGTLRISIGIEDPEAIMGEFRKAKEEA